MRRRGRERRDKERGREYGDGTKGNRRRAWKARKEETEERKKIRK